MSEFVKQNQCIIKSNEAKAIGRTGLMKQTDELMLEFFNDICKAVLNGENDTFVIQWGIIKLEEEDKNAIA